MMQQQGRSMRLWLDLHACAAPWQAIQTAQKCITYLVDVLKVVTFRLG